jgi:hypothetical protein
MDSKKLAKLIKVIVEAEVAKKHEQFLSTTFPKILEEEVSRRLKGVKGGVASPSTQLVETEIDPFEMANKVLQKERTQVQQKQLSKNPAINEILNQTQPFSSAQRTAGPVGGSSVLDKFQQPVQESYVPSYASHVPSYMDAEPDIDQTITMGSSLGVGGVDAMRAQMAAKMGYGDMGGATHTTRSGLGVTTGLPGLDRILNRDNSELVKKFKR